MKQLCWSITSEAIFYKGKVYGYTYHAHMIYTDDISTSTKSIKDFEEFAERHNSRSYAEKTGKIILYTDDMCEHTFKKEYFRGVIVKTEIISVPDHYDFLQIMQKLKYKDFIEFVKDNGLTIGGK